MCTDGHRKTTSFYFKSEEDEFDERLTNDSKKTSIYPGKSSIAAKNEEVVMVPLLLSKPKENEDSSEPSESTKFSITFLDVMSMQTYGKFIVF